MSGGEFGIFFDTAVQKHPAHELFCAFNVQTTHPFTDDLKSMEKLPNPGKFPAFSDGQHVVNQRDRTIRLMNVLNRVA